MLVLAPMEALTPSPLNGNTRNSCSTSRPWLISRMPLCQRWSREKTGALSTWPRSQPFSLALWAQYRKLGVRVVVLCPGPTATNFFTTLGADDVPMLSKMHTPEAVVVAGLRALEQGRPYAVA